MPPFPIGIQIQYTGRVESYNRCYSNLITKVCQIPLVTKKVIKAMAPNINIFRYFTLSIYLIVRLTT